MRKILITGIGGDVACAIIRCLLDDKELELYGFDIKEHTPYESLLTKTFVAPKYTDKSYMSYVREIITSYKITHFLPTTEPEIVLADQERNSFVNIKLMINNHEIIETCTSKYKTAEYLKKHNIDAPETYYAENYDGELDYPFIVKADKSWGSKGLRVIHNDVEWKDCNKTAMVCQRMIGTPDDEYTVGVFSDGSVVNSITLKRQLGYGGLSAFVECCDITEITKIAEKVAKVFNLRGSFNIQLRQDGNHFYIFEINPRFSSTTGFRHKFGFQDVLWWLDMLDGKNIKKFHNTSVGKIGIKVLDDSIIGGGGTSLD